MSRVRPAEAFDAVAEAVDRLAALVAAGAGPPQAWRYLALHGSDGAERRLAAEVAAGLAAGADPLAPFLALAREDARAGPAWLRIGLLVAVATEVGAPLGPALRRGADGIREAAELQRSVGIATAGPAASARLVLALPPAAVLLAQGLGFEAVPLLLTTPLGGSALALAAVLLLLAACWTRRLVQQAAVVDWHGGALVELAALAVRAGLPVTTARQHARALVERAGLAVDAELAVLDDTVAFAAAGGLPLAALLEAEAHRSRRSSRATGLRAAGALQARLLLPLGVLVLPAFLLVGALPIGLSILSSTTLPL